jgi:hypothetical protein
VARYRARQRAMRQSMDHPPVAPCIVSASHIVFRIVSSVPSPAAWNRFVIASGRQHLHIAHRISLTEGEITCDLFGFLTTEANKEVGRVHPKAMPVILTEPEEWETWLQAMGRGGAPPTATA